MAEAPKDTPVLPPQTLPRRGSAAYSSLPAHECISAEDMAKQLAARRAEALARPETIGSQVRNGAAYLLTPGRFTPGPLAPDAERMGHYRAEDLRKRLLETGKIMAIPATMLTGEMLPAALTARAMLGVRGASTVNTSSNPDTQALALGAYHAYNEINNPIAAPVVGPVIKQIKDAVSTAVSAILPSAAAASKSKNMPTL